MEKKERKNNDREIENHDKLRNHRKNRLSRFACKSRSVLKQVKNENDLRALKIVRDRLTVISVVILWAKTSTQCQPAIRRSFFEDKIGGARGGSKRGCGKRRQSI